MTNAVGGSHDLAIALSKLGVLVGVQPMFRLVRDSYSFACCDYRHE
jgi:hypothetical protein